MPLPSPAGIFVELAILPFLTLPLGAAVLRAGESIARHTVRLTPVERALLAVYAGGAVLFVLASIPLPLYGAPLVLVVLVGGLAGYTVCVGLDRGRGLRATLRFLATPPGILLGALFAGVLAFEVLGVSSLTFGNMLDGSLYSLFINLLLSQHTIATTFLPYASVGVTYPQGGAVWMSLPVVLFGWPIVSAPLQFPGLFLALSVPAAYCLGSRLATGHPRASTAWLGLLTAAFFGLVVTWPRLAIGGSFDFAIGLPLFLLTLGWLTPFVRRPSRTWNEIGVLGLVVGVEISLSLMLGLCTLLLLVGYWLAFRTPGGVGPLGWAARGLVVCGIASAFLVRSLVGVALWFEYPGHVLLPVGSPPPAPLYLATIPSWGTVNGELNPFVWLKPKISPFPGLTVEIQVLLAAGLVLSALVLLRPTSSVRRHLPGRMVEQLVVGTTVMVLLIGGLFLLDAASLTGSGAESVTNLDELSAVLFIFYELIALLPLLAAASYLSASRENTRVRDESNAGGRARWNGASGASRNRARAGQVLVALVILVPVASGVGVTSTVVPGYISHHIHELANVSSGDVGALEWVGTHLPPCSRVLIAPGSIGQYLPEYASVQIVYPAFPTPANLSYYTVVQNLNSGTYTNSTRANLLLLGITEVLGSAQNTVSFLPFKLGPLEASADFRTLFASGDVTILEFLPGVNDFACAP